MQKVLFYQTDSGREIILDFIRALDRDDMKIVGEDLRVIQLGFPIGPPLCVNLGKGLWEVRSTISGPREVRLIFFHASEQTALVIVNAFIKKTRKTPRREIDLALSRKREFGL